MKLVSACLMGVNCKYNGKNNYRPKVAEQCKEAVRICPEVMGGLKIPHVPSEIQKGYSGLDVLEGRAKVISAEGGDMTAYFLNGAREVLRIAEKVGAKQIYLKQSSPSCGCGKIYDGTFCGRKVNGYGVCAALLRQEGFEVIPIE